MVTAPLEKTSYHTGGNVRSTACAVRSTAFRRQSRIAMSIDLKYGRHGRFACELNPRRLVVHHPGPAPCATFAAKVRKALTTPLDFPSLVQVCVPGDQVVLALDRHTPG